MRIGFSLGRCIRDIVKGEVDINDVVVIVAGTKFTTQEQLTRIVDEYMYSSEYLGGLDAAECHSVASILFQTGKIHMARNFGEQVGKAPEISLWADLVPTGGHTDPMVQEAWQAYRVMLNLTSNVPDKEKANAHWGR